ncbi:hypothetical protein THICB1_10187 [Thiomonas arsenitoxydans]|jgi:hypothetical protein|uniref:Uncharacterized protein n=1 Tax=Thiomonas arsenitoxydans (strain DSM 22701 / CIP 110005 / 3As) TaxID=426114 RepID=A0ABM9T3A1_THIA3|nr:MULTISPECIES: hypothetical protein [Thiomonas]MDE2175510.1 hypothetical protein [Betaproteobacteria bacterium]CQR44203.1 hypothetical protein THICB3490050 [Thiomonas sp. CB3]OZB70551.1 MAG: hypothetical protein B7X30_08185 [Thiomonas sp. 13-64-67]CDW95864.1 hypothetical protein THICB2_720007 [Thiomonas sp. CB2]CQR26444.1 hypothetical protein THICB1_10187 [Thiomonas arsenitoxydans]
MFKNPEFEADFGKQSPEFTRQAMAAAMRGEPAQFAVPVFRVVGETLRLDGAQKVEVNPDKAAIYPGSQFGAASFSIIPVTETMRFKMMAGEPMTAKDAPDPVEFGNQVVVTHSVASALAIYHATGERAIVLPSFTPDNMKSVAEFAKNTLKAKDIVVVPDNTVASKRAAHEAARAVDGKVAQIDYGPEQKNLLGVMAEAHKWADKLFPAPETVLDEVRRDKTLQDAAKRTIREPIANAQKWDKVPVPTLVQGRPVSVQRQPMADIER